MRMSEVATKESKMPEENTEVTETEEATSTIDDTETSETQEDQTDADVIEKTLIDTDGKDEGEEGKEEGESEADAGKKEESSTKFEMPDLGEGVEFDTTLFETMTPVLEEMGATQEQVNKLAEAYLGHVKTAADIHGKKMIEKYEEIKDGWKKEATEELGANMKQDLVQTGNALKQFGSEKLIELFNETGIGNHVEVVKMLSKVGKHFTEDNFEDGESSGSESKTEDVLYPSMNK